MFWPDSRPCSEGGKKVAVSVIVGIGVAALCLVIFIVGGIIWWKRSFRGKLRRKKGEVGLSVYSLQGGIGKASLMG